jgi:quercetin dioxygenase-like cupin family protein
MRKLTNIALLALVGVLAAVIPLTAKDGDGDSKAQASEEKPGPKFENLLKASLERVKGTEVIVSRVTIPPHTSLPKHWHPGEEFGYVLEGSIILWQDGKDDIVGKAGDVLKVPLKQVHTAMTTDEGATILVFRVHELGKPERVPVE